MQSSTTVADDVALIRSIASIPPLLDLVAHITGLRFVCIARVTNQTWTACAVLDELGMGIGPGSTLPLASTFCREVQANNRSMFFDSASEHPDYRDHPIPKLYNIEAYFAVPIQMGNGEVIGTLCGVDSVKRSVESRHMQGILTRFAHLVAVELERDDRRKMEKIQSLDRDLKNRHALAAVSRALIDEKATAELREKFVGVLGHDLRNPLNSIMLSSSMLEKQSLDIRSHALAARIRKSALRMSGLINDVIDFTRGRLGEGIPLNPIVHFNLEEQLDLVIEELRTAHPASTILSEMAPPLEVVCDAARIAQLLSNLLKNALVHGDQDQAVLVGAKNHEGRFLLLVENFGTPIPQALQPDIFTAFVRGKNRRNGDGLGLGLYIVAEIAKAHGGSISVKSDEKSTVFCLDIPNGKAAG